MEACSRQNKYLQQVCPCSSKTPSFSGFCNSEKQRQCSCFFSLIFLSRTGSNVNLKFFYFRKIRKWTPVGHSSSISFRGCVNKTICLKIFLPKTTLKKSAWGDKVFNTHGCRLWNAGYGIKRSKKVTHLFWHLYYLDQLWAHFWVLEEGH